MQHFSFAALFLGALSPASGGALAARPMRAAQELGLQECAAEHEAESERVLTVLEGHVLTPEGWPASGAVVVSREGGRCVTGADGSFRLELELPGAARGVSLTAVQGAGTTSAVANATVALGGAGRATSTGVLRLTRGSSCPPAWLPTFGAMPGTNAPVRALAVFDDGSGAGPMLYAGGEFYLAGAVQASYIARWDGSSWTPLGAGVYGSPVHALAVFDDGSGPALYAGTAFGFGTWCVLRWDGTNWWGVGSAQGYAFALTVFDDGSGAALYAGGSLTLSGGTAAGRVARWNGASWSALGGTFDEDVLALSVFDDGSGPALYAGGEFTSAGGTAVGRIARWNGASWSPLGAGLDGTSLTVAVLALTSFDDGSGGGPALCAGGIFTSAGGVAVQNVARWNGASWSALGAGREGRVHALAVFDDGSGPALYAGGRSASGTAANRIGRPGYAVVVAPCQSANGSGICMRTSVPGH